MQNLVRAQKLDRHNKADPLLVITSFFLPSLLVEFGSLLSVSFDPVYRHNT
jgi:hypothetical protein